jgi:hypothetical protein
MIPSLVKEVEYRRKDHMIRRTKKGFMGSFSSNLSIIAI